MATVVVKKKMTAEEKRAINAAKPARNRSIAAFRKHRGELKVYDPALLA